MKNWGRMGYRFSQNSPCKKVFHFFLKGCEYKIKGAIAENSKLHPQSLGQVKCFNFAVINSIDEILPKLVKIQNTENLVNFDDTHAL